MQYPGFYQNVAKVPLWNSLKTTWQMSVQSAKLFAPLMFIYLRFMILFEAKSSPQWGFPYPEFLPIVSVEQLPQEAVDDLGLLIRSFEMEGYEFLYFTKPNLIGKIVERYTAILLDRSRKVWVLISWQRLTMPKNLETNEVFIEKQISPCLNSYLANGNALRTLPIEVSRLAAAKFAKGNVLMGVPTDTSISELCRVHQENLLAQSSLATEFDDGFLQQHILQLAQNDFQFRIENGQYRELAPAEVSSIINGTV